MDENNLQQQFDQWAATYDADVGHYVGHGTGFPFDGYNTVLERVIELAAIEPGMEVLELGPGTGNLTARLVTAGAEVWAVDFSAEMLARAHAKVPAAHLAQAGLLDDYPPDFRRPFARVVSTYTFHELPLADKLALLRRLAGDTLQPGGRIVIGDIGFPDAAARDAIRNEAGESWDDEYYWIMDEAGPALSAAGFAIDYEQLSMVGMTLVITRPS